jgi:hypothetical protein
MRRLSAVAALTLTLGLALALGTAPGCTKIKKMLPAKTIDNPTAGSPEWVVREAMAAAMDPDEGAGWKRFKPLLHTSQLGRGSLSSWRTLNFSAFRRKWDLYVVNAEGVACRTAKCDRAKTAPVYELKYTEDEDDNTTKLFVVNMGNPDYPTPCKLKKDADQGGEWKILMCSF